MNTAEITSNREQILREFQSGFGRLYALVQAVMLAASITAMAIFALVAANPAFSS